MLLRYIMMISGIFGKSDNLDILPPPPPFPEIGKEEVQVSKTEIKEKRKVSGIKDLKKKLGKKKGKLEPIKKIPRINTKILSRAEDREIEIEKPEKESFIRKNSA